MKVFASVIMFIMFLLIVISLLMLTRLFTSEDSWIKDSRGVWIKHGVPASTPNYVLKQQEAINCSLTLYNEKKQEMNLSSQCLGKCGEYSVDIVHVPRTDEDDLEENQCSLYRDRITTRFIELDNEGDIVKVS